MGDRCYFSVWVPASARETASGVMQSEPEDSSGAALHYEDYEANYGGGHLLEELVANGIPFIGFHAAGGNYSGYEFCSDGKTLCEVAAYEGDYVISFDEEGTPSQVDIDRVKAFIVMHRRVKAKLFSTPLERLAVAGLEE